MPQSKETLAGICNLLSDHVPCPCWVLLAGCCLLGAACWALLGAAGCCWVLVAGVCIACAAIHALSHVGVGAACWVLLGAAGCCWVLLAGDRSRVLWLVEICSLATATGTCQSCHWQQAVGWQRPQETPAVYLALFLGCYRLGWGSLSGWLRVPLGLAWAPIWVCCG